VGWQTINGRLRVACYRTPNATAMMDALVLRGRNRFHDPRRFRATTFGCCCGKLRAQSRDRFYHARTRLILGKHAAPRAVLRRAGADEHYVMSKLAAI
jgi:hypothetical protein